MATHSSVLAWRIPGTGKPGRLQSMGSRRVRHDWATSFWLSLLFFSQLFVRPPQTAILLFCISFSHLCFISLLFWRRHWRPTPVLLPGESHGWMSLACHGPWGCRESDTTEVAKHTLCNYKITIYFYFFIDILYLRRHYLHTSHYVFKHCFLLLFWTYL